MGVSVITSNEIKPRPNQIADGGYLGYGLSTPTPQHKLENFSVFKNKKSRVQSPGEGTPGGVVCGVNDRVIWEKSLLSYAGWDSHKDGASTP